MKVLTCTALLLSFSCAFAYAERRESFTRPQETFQRVKRTLLHKYYRSGITENELYEAATQGMLNNFDPQMSQWNRLLSPAEYAEMRADLSGKTTGIGLEVEFIKQSGIVEITNVISESPAEKAGLKRGQKILKVDGQGFSGKEFAEVIGSIRGPVGSEVELKVLEDESVKTIKLKREAIAWDVVSAQVIENDVALIRIPHFTDRTPSLLENSLKEMAAKKVTSLVVDLRGNQGGVLNSAISCIELMVPKGKSILEASLRDDVRKEYIAERGSILGTIPTVVLINKETKSGGEFMAAALKETANATIVGTPTFGKWSAQSVEELPNRFAIKYTTMKFRPPSHTDHSGKGVPADIVVELDPEVVQKLQRKTDFKARSHEDTQLLAALSFLKKR